MVKLKSITERESGLLMSDIETRISRSVSDKAMELTIEIDENFWSKGQKLLESLAS